MEVEGFLSPLSPGGSPLSALGDGVIQPTPSPPRLSGDEQTKWPATWGAQPQSPSPVMLEERVTPIAVRCMASWAAPGGAAWPQSLPPCPSASPPLRSNPCPSSSPPPLVSRRTNLRVSSSLPRLQNVALESHRGSLNHFVQLRLWCPRFAVLGAHHLELFANEGATTQACLEKLHMQGVEIKTLRPEASTGFGIALLHRPTRHWIVLSCSTERQREEWLDALRRARDRISREPPNSGASLLSPRSAASPLSTPVPIVSTKACANCHASFTFFKRRHACGFCSGTFCKKCSTKTADFAQPIKSSRKARTCRRCVRLLISVRWEPEPHGLHVLTGLPGDHSTVSVASPTSVGSRSSFSSTQSPWSRGDWSPGTTTPGVPGVFRSPSPDDLTPSIIAASPIDLHAPHRCVPSSRALPSDGADLEQPGLTRASSLGPILFAPSMTLLDLGKVAANSSTATTWQAVAQNEAGLPQELGAPPHHRDARSKSQLKLIALCMGIDLCDSNRHKASLSRDVRTKRIAAPTPAALQPPSHQPTTNTKAGLTL